MYYIKCYNIYLSNSIPLERKTYTPEEEKRYNPYSQLGIHYTYFPKYLYSSNSMQDLSFPLLWLGLQIFFRTTNSKLLFAYIFIHFHYSYIIVTMNLTNIFISKGIELENSCFKIFVKYMFFCHMIFLVFVLNGDYKKPKNLTYFIMTEQNYLPTEPTSVLLIFN